MFALKRHMSSNTLKSGWPSMKGLSRGKPNLLLKFLHLKRNLTGSLRTVWARSLPGLLLKMSTETWSSIGMTLQDRKSLSFRIYILSQSLKLMRIAFTEGQGTTLYRHQIKEAQPLLWQQRLQVCGKVWTTICCYTTSCLYRDWRLWSEKPW